MNRRSRSLAAIQPLADQQRQDRSDLVHVQPSTAPDFTVRVGSDAIFPAASVRNLSIHLDSYVSMKTHITKTMSKLSVLCFRCLHGLVPPYLADDLHRVADIEARRRLRYASTTMHVVPRTRLSTFGDRSFPVVAPRTWNNLPQHVVSLSSLPTFKRHLKTVFAHKVFLTVK